MSKSEFLNGKSIDDLLYSLDELMEVLNVDIVKKDSNYNPHDVFSTDFPDIESKEASPEIISKTEDFLIKLRDADFPGGILQYSRVSERMFSKVYSVEAIEGITFKILKITKNHFSEMLDSNPELKKRFYKLVDHIQLANFQITEIAQHSRVKYNELIYGLTISRKELKKHTEKYEKELKEMTAAREDINNELSKIYVQFVTILGIFTAIVFSMFGGLELLEFTLTAQRFVTWKAVVFFSMFAIATLCMLFTLMRWISMIIDNVNRSKRTFRYRGILSSHFGFTVAMIFFIYLIFIAALFSNQNILENFQLWVEGFSNYLILGFILLLPVLIFSLFLVVYLFNRNHKKS